MLLIDLFNKENKEKEQGSEKAFSSLRSNLF